MKKLDPNVGSLITTSGAASIHEMKGEFERYYGVVVGKELRVITPAWHAAAEQAARLGRSR